MRTYFRIPDGRFDEFELRVEKANRKARRLRQPAITYTVIHDERVERKTGTVNVFDPETGRTREVPRITISWYRITEVTGNRPHVAGHDFLGTLDFEPGGVIFSAAPGQTIPEAYRTATPFFCEHCRTVRRRKNTFVLRDTETGATIMIGRNCLADYLGGASAAEILGRFEFSRLADELGECEDEYASDGGSRRTETEVTTAYLAQVAAMIRTQGWVSGTMARNATEDRPLTSTASAAWANMYSSPAAIREGEYVRLTEADVTLAQAAFEWAPTLEGDSDYAVNVRVLFAAQDDTHTFRIKHSGTVASVVAMYLRHLDRLEERKQQVRCDEFFGTPKKREIFTLRLEVVKQFESQFGVTTMFRFVDEAGRPAVWFASNDPVLGVTEIVGVNAQQNLSLMRGYTFSIKATVKAHETYRRQKQTVLTRASVEAIVAAPEAPGQKIREEEATHV